MEADFLRGLRYGIGFALLLWSALGAVAWIGLRLIP
jgi:hypothetical protein